MKESGGMEGGEYRIKFIHRIFLPIEGGDYEGVQSFS